MMLYLMCPKCGNKMKYSPATKFLKDGARKSCVYCGKSFAIRPAIVKKIN